MGPVLVVVLVEGLKLVERLELMRDLDLVDDVDSSKALSFRMLWHWKGLWACWVQ